MIQTLFKILKQSRILILVLAASGTGYTASPISVDAKVDKAQITLGDVITFSVIVRRDPDMEVTPPNVSSPGFDFVASGVGKPFTDKGQTVDEFWFRLRADETGSHTIDPIPVLFTSPDPKNKNQKIQGRALTAKTTVEVKSVLRLQGEPKDIRDIKPIIPMGKGNEYYWLGLLLLVLAVLATWLWKRRKSTHQTQRALLPHEQALHELESLKAKQLLEQGKVQAHYFELSEIFRRYLGRRYSFPSLDWTTEEIHYKLQNLTSDNALCQQAHTILIKTDKVKFAKATVNDHAETIASIIQFIQTTGYAPPVFPVTK